MKTKKRTIGVLITSLLASLCLLCFGGLKLHSVYAEEATTEDTVVTQEPVATETPTEDFNTKIKAWFDTILGGAGLGLDVLLIALISKKDKKEVTVAVNDSDTQQKLDALHKDYNILKQLILDTVKLEKGTLNVLDALYSENKGLDGNVRSILKAIQVNAEDVIKDVTDLADAETHKAAKTALDAIGNVVLG